MKWISVEDRLPEIGDKIIAYGDFWGEIHDFQGKHVGSGEWVKGCYVDIKADAYYCHIYNVTHWMPLPEPPKEKE